jgi:hypothetical protein
MVRHGAGSYGALVMTCPGCKNEVEWVNGWCGHNYSRGEMLLLCKKLLDMTGQPSDSEELAAATLEVINTL